MLKIICKSRLWNLNQTALCVLRWCVYYIFYVYCPVQMCVSVCEKMNKCASEYVCLCMSKRKMKNKLMITYESTEQKRNEKISNIYKWNTARCKQSKDSFFQYIFVFASNIQRIHIKKIGNVQKEQKFPIYISAVDFYDAKLRSLIFCK